MPILKNLARPLTYSPDIDDPHTTALRRRSIRQKAFLRKIYEEWYSLIAVDLPEGNATVLEIGSGPGFLGEFIPNLITSDVIECPGIRAVLDGSRLPFPQGSLRGIVMTDVLHHLPRPRAFFTEAGRCVIPGGLLVMIEPWVTTWSRWVYSNLHHEPFDTHVAAWEFASSGPLSGANGALPWIIFQRDREQFEREFPFWQIRMARPLMPFRYLLSGGFSMPSLMPGFSFGMWKRFEMGLGNQVNRLAMFAQIELRHL